MTTLLFIKCPIYKDCGKINIKTPNFHNKINRQVLERSSLNFSFKYQIDIKAGVTD